MGKTTKTTDEPGFREPDLEPSGWLRAANVEPVSMLISSLTWYRID